MYILLRVVYILLGIHVFFFIRKPFFTWGGGLFSGGFIIGLKNKLRNAWAYTRGKKSC